MRFQGHRRQRRQEDDGYSNNKRSNLTVTVQVNGSSNRCRPRGAAAGGTVTHPLKSALNSDFQSFAERSLETLESL